MPEIPEMGELKIYGKEDTCAGEQKDKPGMTADITVQPEQEIVKFFYEKMRISFFYEPVNVTN